MHLIVVCTDSWDNSRDSNENANIDLRRKEENLVSKVSTIRGAHRPRSVQMQQKTGTLHITFIWQKIFLFGTSMVWPLPAYFPLPTVGNSCLCFPSFRNSPCLFRIRIDCFTSTEVLRIITAQNCPNNLLPADELDTNFSEQEQVSACSLMLCFRVHRPSCYTSQCTIPASYQVCLQFKHKIILK